MNPIWYIVVLAGALFGLLGVSVVSLYVYRLNRSLRRSVAARKLIEESLRESEERYRVIVNASPDGMIRTDLKGRIVTVSCAALKMFGFEREDQWVGHSVMDYIFPEDRERAESNVALMVKGVMTGPAEYRAVRACGSILETEINGEFIRDAEGNPMQMVFIVRDIAARKMEELCREMSAEVLQILNEQASLPDSIQRIIHMIKTRTGVDAVGIRLQNGDDFPYFTQDGFSKDFLLTENTLIEVGKEGGVCRDSQGHISLECTCGLVISGKTDPASPFCTRAGSFWTNDSFPLLDLPADQDPRRHPRNQCIHQGYASVALVPIRTRKGIVGLLQLNDRRKGCFSRVQIEELEGLAAHISEALMRKQTEDQVRSLLAESNRARLTLLGILEDESRAKTNLTRLMAAIEHSSEVVFITDVQGTIQYVNPAFEAVTGYTHDEAIGQNPRILKSGQQDDAFYRKMWETLCGGHTWKGRFVNRRKNGSLYTEDATISPVLDEAGAISNYVAVKRDITDELHQQSLLMQAQKMESVGRLAGGVAHDFNNLLMGIMGYAELCRTGLPPDHPIQGHLDEITQISQRSADLTRQLLAFARKQIISPKVLDLNEAVSSMLKLMRRLIGEQITLSWKPFANLWPVKIDPSQLDQILANLCVNARDAMTGGGRIAIETAPITLDPDFCVEHPGFVPGEYVMLTVSDDGSGMSQEVLAQIFEPFFTTKGVGRGTGLGLATVYGIVKQNKGYIDVASEPGKGTTFKIYLPRAEGVVAKEAVQSPVEADRRPVETILLTEDEKSLRVTCGIFLEKLGYKVLVADSPAAALEIVARHPGDLHLLLTDVIMPGMSGWDLAQKIRALKPGLAVLYMSGYTADALANQGGVIEGNHFIQKPFSRDDLAVKVREVLEKG